MDASITGTGPTLADLRYIPRSRRTLLRLADPGRTTQNPPGTEWWAGRLPEREQLTDRAFRRHEIQKTARQLRPPNGTNTEPVTLGRVSGRARIGGHVVTPQTSSR